MNPKALQIQCYGTIQGVGFRPFVFRLANRLGLNGWVRNLSSQVDIHVQGSEDHLESFLTSLRNELPAGAHLKELKSELVCPDEFNSFQILESLESNSVSSSLLPDAATCKSCLQNLNDPSDRRHNYPFTTCTVCGPRYSLSYKMPFDRQNLSIKEFPPCRDCHEEYKNSEDRRFHAQTITCPNCGPKLTHSIDEVANQLKKGQIVALKGMAGYHLMVRADDCEAVARLRIKKHRPTKPLAVMAKLSWIEKHFDLSDTERNWLTSSAAPIVLLKNRQAPLADNVAPDFHEHGLMLPATALHHLLIEKVGAPIVTTSGNLSDEPICIDEVSANNLPADLIVHHNLPLVRGLDDSVVKCAEDRTIVIRRAKGMVPQPLPSIGSESALALGGQLKNTIAFGGRSETIMTRPHGDLSELESLLSFEKDVQTLPKYFNVQAESTVCDLHPDYESTHFAECTGLPVFQVQHHVAHVLGCAFENHLQPPFLGVAWDGIGYGCDGSFWGGEFFKVKSYNEVERIAHFHPFKLFGGDRAAKEPRRIGLALLVEAIGAEAFQHAWTKRTFTDEEIRFWQNRPKGIETTSVGRLIDGVASLLDICHSNSFEGEAAMKLEGYFSDPTAKPFHPIGLDWRPWIVEIIKGGHPQALASRFLSSLIESISFVARSENISDIALSGGVFQNRELVARLPNGKIHQSVPPNDSGLSLGQLVAAHHKTRLICV